MRPSVNPKPPFTSCSLASGDTSASSAGASLTTAGLSPCACALAPQAPRVAAKRTAAEIEDFFFMTPPIATLGVRPRRRTRQRKENARIFCHSAVRLEPRLDQPLTRAPALLFEHAQKRNTQSFWRQRLLDRARDGSELPPARIVGKGERRSVGRHPRTAAIDS